MANQRSISKYFSQDVSDENFSYSDTSLTPCPSDLSVPFSTPLKPKPSKQSPTKPSIKRPSFTDTGPSRDESKASCPSQQSSFGTSFTNSQRVVKGGQVMVTGSDEEDSGSDFSLEADDILSRFLNPGKSKQPAVSSEVWTKSSQLPTTSSYGNSLFKLVAQAENERATEEKIKQLKSKLDSPKGKRASPNVNQTPNQRRKAMQERLARVIDDGGDPDRIAMLKMAIERTEAVDQAKSWSFFENSSFPVTQPAFPTESLASDSWELVLKDPITRERALLSGLVEDTLEGTRLPDEVFAWMLEACTTEPRDDTRFAFCSTVKSAPIRRVSSQVHPINIERMFRNIGARPEALQVNDVLVPEFRESDELGLHENKFIISALDVISGLSAKLNNDARDFALKVILRLSLDEVRMRDCLLSAATDQAIISLLEDSAMATADHSLHELSRILYNTIKYPVLQGQLMNHICALTPEVALFRCRLAAAYFFEDASFLDKSKKSLFDIERMITRFDDDRFKLDRNTKPRNRKPKSSVPSENSATANDGVAPDDHNTADGLDTPEDPEPYDPWELRAIISLLNIAIDSGTASKSFPSREAQFNFDRNIDKLAERIHFIFKGIQDAGASHLGRTETKAFLEMVRCRLLYGVRTRPYKVHNAVGIDRNSIDGSWGGIGFKKSSNIMAKYLQKNPGSDDIAYETAPET